MYYISSPFDLDIHAMVELVLKIDYLAVSFTFDLDISHMVVWVLRFSCPSVPLLTFDMSVMVEWLLKSVIYQFPC